MTVNRATWDFWIDVGGTFTDCVARRPSGKIETCKLLSSGRIKATAAEGSDARTLNAPALSEFSAGFFEGFNVAVALNDGDADRATGSVASFDRDQGKLTLREPLPAAPSIGASIELSSGEPAPIVAIRRVLGLRLRDPIDDAAALRVRLGTTRGTNALLERKGARVALLTTRGFADLPEIGTQARPELFKLDVRKPPLLHERVVELDERIAADGQVLRALDEAATERALAELRDAGFDSLAICLLNAYVNPSHEQRVAAIAERLGFGQVSASAALSPTIKMLDRCDTAVVDAYLSPVIRQYVRDIRATMPRASLKLMTSAGGLVEAEQFAGKDSLLSGPAGGVVGFADVARRAGFDKAIGFDMGGTSTDVSRFDGEYEYQFTAEKAGVRIVSPMFAIETVAAGGGSICRFDGQKLTVGPDSAGADPGPACYGRGGPLTVTDINLFNGKIDQTRFPFTLDAAVVREKLTAMADDIERATGQRKSEVEIADGFTRIANDRMAGAIKQISAAKGYDPRDYVLVSFGGAGAQHACAIATALGIEGVLLHPLAGVLSAYGAGVAEVRRFADQTVLKALSDATLSELEPLMRDMEQRVRGEVTDEGVPDDRVRVTRLLDLRNVGEESTITVRQPDDGDFAKAFAAMHEQLYGHVHEDRDIEIVNARVEAAGKAGEVETASSGTGVSPVDGESNGRDARSTAPQPIETRPACFAGVEHDAAIIARESLLAGDVVRGPAIVTEAYSTIVVDPDWEGEVTERGDLVLRFHKGTSSERWDSPQSSIRDESEARMVIGRAREAASGEGAAAKERDPVRLELFSNHFTHIATQMGVTLQRTSLSVNVKERLDFSCAILDGEGNLVVNAPHIPVHLGAMSEAVKALLANVMDLQPGDVYASNDPDLGGSHLPDVTVITPVFAEAGSAVRFFVASRAHHAEIGGVRPGSAFPFAKNLAEEGVVLRNLLIARGGRFRENELRAALADGPYPSRSPNENVADIRAAVAANRVGLRELNAMIARHGWPTVAAYMRHMRDAAEEKVRAAIARLPKREGLGEGEGACDTTSDRTAASSASRQSPPPNLPLKGEGSDARHTFTFTFTDQLDDGAPVRVAIDIVGDTLTINFAGTGPVNANSLNANRAIVQAAVLYCLRCLVDEDIPLNQGVLSPIDLRLPACMLNPPAEPDPTKHAAVVGGNVELSQKVVDVIFGALGVAAASQGTMNNFVFGDDTFGYYETIGGGAGAGPTFSGASAVHTHMTNTRLTDVEVLERRFPVRVHEFAVRRGSGGVGEYRGGDGIARSIEFLKQVEVSLLTQRRATAPFGLAGGEDGKPGENLLRRAGSNDVESLPGLAQFTANPGDVLTIKTPGGGGYGTSG